MDEIWAGRNPLSLIKTPDGQEVYVVSHSNKVKTAKEPLGKEDFETYIFASGQQPRLKLKYTKEDE